MNYRPPDNRRPTDEEIKRYLPLITKLEIINPKILVLLGSTAMNALIENDIVISKMRGKWIEKFEMQNFSNYYISPCFFNEATCEKENGLD